MYNGTENRILNIMTVLALQEKLKTLRRVLILFIDIKNDGIWRFECPEKEAWVFHETQILVNCVSKITFLENIIFLAEVAFE